MWRKEHGFTLANVLRASFPITILSLIVLIVSSISKNDPLETWSRIVLIISVSVSVFNFCFIFPFKKYQQDTDALRQELKGVARLVELEETQRKLLLDNPSVYVQVFVRKIILYQSSIEHTNFAEIALYIVNGSIFPLDYDLELKETELTADKVSLNRLSTLPSLYRKGAERLEAGRVQNSTLIRQPLSGDIVDYVYNQNKAIYSQWKLCVFLTIKFEGHSKQHKYTPEWDGVIDRKYPTESFQNIP